MRVSPDTAVLPLTSGRLRAARSGNMLPVWGLRPVVSLPQRSARFLSRQPRQCAVVGGRFVSFAVCSYHVDARHPSFPRLHRAVLALERLRASSMLLLLLSHVCPAVLLFLGQDITRCVTLVRRFSSRR
jgi:hypothetical protein